ncbi:MULTISPECIES: acyl carrier protein [Rhodococcus]|uniref:Phosphopantetheine-binding protein n=3 Tax=Rhodococcus TaxID=1827 RepID=M2ZEI0_9NOCA|nr:MULTISPECIES: acyl carrier protein [Rhodococcus]EME65707.1 phosphopantetheine-binding protein [Rhodococcus ruber BKS 20-38]KOS54593.1 phosphopantetheine-binding protein [Rhodococcus rhodochrous KG-21]MDM7489671.1 acyl carrier protein [Rhodococcus indonesiensis]
MTTDETEHGEPAGLRAAVVAAIADVAPEIEDLELEGDRPLRQQVDLDSMDWLNVLIGLRSSLGVDIPEADYAHLSTLDGLVDYLAQRLAQ